MTYVDGECIVLDGNHYTIGNSKFVRVTRVLSIIRSKWLEQWRGNLGNEEADRIRYEAGDLGTEFHQLCYAYNRGEQPFIPREYIDMFDAYLRWFEACIGRIVECETTTVSRKYGYAGTFDLRAVLKGDTIPSVIDIKTSNNIQPQMALQLAAYRTALLEEGKETNRRLIVRVDKMKKGQLSVKEYTDHHRDLVAFLSALNLWKYFNL